MQYFVLFRPEIRILKYSTLMSLMLRVVIEDYPQKSNVYGIRSAKGT